MKNHLLPVGTIISSYLNWDEFQNVTDNNSLCIDFLFHSKKSFWSPCDGRILDPESKLSLASTNLTKVPDLRGLFLRGFNIMDENESGYGITVVEDGDPDNHRIRGQRQNDDIKKHSHSYDVNKNDIDGSNSGTSKDPAKKHFKTESTGISGGEETRPKNMAVYYYIKIN